MIDNPDTIEFRIGVHLAMFDEEASETWDKRTWQNAAMYWLRRMVVAEEKNKILMDNAKHYANPEQWTYFRREINPLNNAYLSGKHGYEVSQKKLKECNELH